MSQGSRGSLGSSLGRQFGNAVQLNKLQRDARTPLQYGPAALNEMEQMRRLNALEIERRRYIQSLKTQIQQGRSESKLLEDVPSKPRIYNSLETRQDKIINQMYLFPDTDPAVYTRKIEYTNVFTHEPVFGF
jgi:hypothetical protein